jgi:Rrf2 family nitric oxide-sensitive transcriptional repressor
LSSWPGAASPTTCLPSNWTTSWWWSVATLAEAGFTHVEVNGLQAHGFIETQRGRHGGLRLARPPEQVSMGAVFRVFEAGHPFAECFDAETNTCPLSTECRLRGYIARAVEAFYHELDIVTLEDLTRGNCGLEALLNVPDTLADACHSPVARA